MGVTNELGIKSAVTQIPVDTLIDNALALHNGNKTLAARELGISRWALDKRLRKRATAQPTAGK